MVISGKRVPLNVLTSSQVKEFHGNTRLTGLTHDKNVSESEMDFNGVVIEIELTPNSEIAKGVVNLNALDEILVGRVGSPSVPSVYAAREITVIKEKQISIAVGQGTSSALKAYALLSPTSSE